MSSSLNKTLPMSLFSKPANIFRVVVLPQPLGPNKVRNSFFLILRDKLFKTVLSPYVLDTFFISIIFYIPLTELYCSQSDQHALINIPISSEFVKKIPLHITVISCRIYNKSTDSQRQPEYCHSAGIFPGLQIP